MKTMMCCHWRTHTLLCLLLFPLFCFAQSDPKYKSVVVGSIIPGTVVSGVAQAGSCHNHYIHVEFSGLSLAIDLNTTGGQPFLLVKESPVIDMAQDDHNFANYYSFKTEREVHGMVVRSEYLSIGRWYIGVCNYHYDVGEDFDVQENSDAHYSMVAFLNPYREEAQATQSQQTTERGGRSSGHQNLYEPPDEDACETCPLPTPCECDSSVWMWTVAALVLVTLALFASHARVRGTDIVVAGNDNASDVSCEVAAGAAESKPPSPPKTAKDKKSGKSARKKDNKVEKPPTPEGDYAELANKYKQSVEMCASLRNEINAMKAEATAAESHRGELQRVEARHQEAQAEAERAHAQVLELKEQLLKSKSTREDLALQQKSLLSLQNTLWEDSNKREKLMREIECLKDQVAVLQGRKIDRLSLSELEAQEREHERAVKLLKTAKELRARQEIQRVRQERDELKELRLCLVCRERAVNQVLIPCNHACLCHVCSDQLLQCPVCRSMITKTRHVFL